MNSKQALPITILAAACASAVLTFAPAATAATAATPFRAAVAAPKATVQRYQLSTGIVDGKMVFLDASGKPNPMLRANVGDTVEITITSGEGALHDIVFPELNVASKAFDKAKGPVTLRFKATRAGTFTYLCSIPGHRQIGMEGVLEVTGSTTASQPAAATAKAAAVVAPAATPARAAARTAPAAKNAVSVAMDPKQVPPPIGPRAPQLVKYRVETVELDGRLDDGTTFTYWTFDKKVPGPMLRVRAGDTVELTLANAATSKFVHSIDLHSATGGHGGGQHTQVGPGQEKTIRFKALNPGLYVYHCATPSVAHHISAGMYGLILVEPAGGLAPVDREFYVMQGDIYTRGAFGTKGHQEFSTDKLADERPDYYVFNGAVGALTKEHKMEAKVGETVRIYFGVGGPNKISSFHVIGEIFDKVYSEASLTTIKKDVQTTLVPAGGAAIVEFKLDYPGSYLLVDHALSRAEKGLVGAIHVSGPADAAIYEAVSDTPPELAH